MPRSKRGAAPNDLEEELVADAGEPLAQGDGDTANVSEQSGALDDGGHNDVPTEDGGGDHVQENGDVLEGELEADPPVLQMEDEFHRMVSKQKEILKALQKEQAAYSKDRADFNKERVQMTEIVKRANGILSRTSSSTDVVKPKASTSTKCPKYNGETEWTAFLVQFETWMRLHGYDKEEWRESWSDLLGLAMDGEAQVFFSGLSEAERSDYYALKNRLEQRYSGDGTAEVFKAKLQSGTKRQPGESLSKMRDSLWLMARKGYPRLPREAQEQIAMDALMRAVDTDLRVQCSMKDCRTLDEAVAVMERYEAVLQSDPERKRKAVKKVHGIPEGKAEELPPAEFKELKGFADMCGEMTNLLNKQLELLSNLKEGQSRKRKLQDKKDLECYRCRAKGHFARDCTKKASEIPRPSENRRPPAES